jgi:predicted RNA-binding Zn ribbon-like protein
VPEASIEELNRYLSERPGYFQLETQGQPQEQIFGDAFGYSFRPLSEAAVNAVAPVAESALWLLAREDLSLVKRCENPECPLFFYDTSKNHRRRWCRMQPCGNRMKAQAHYRRHRIGGF